MPGKGSKVGGSRGWAGSGCSPLAAARRAAGAALPLPGTRAGTRRCLLHRKGQQHRAELCPRKPKAGQRVPFALLLREIRSNPRSAVKHDAEKLTAITPALDPFRAIYKHWVTNPPHTAGGRSRQGFPFSLPPPFCMRRWEVGSCTYFLQATAAMGGGTEQHGQAGHR